MSGIGTVDVAQIVASLMQAQSRPLKTLKDEEKYQEVKLSIYGQLTNYINNINTAAQAVSNAFNTIAFAASVGNSSVLSASITSNTNVFSGTHQINVTSIAQAQVYGANNTFSTRNQALNLSGSLTFTVGGNAFTANISATDTLENIRDNINNSTNNTGVTASIVASTVGGVPAYSLVIASANTGTANAVSITDSASLFNFSNVIATAQDAVFTFDGNNVVRSQNTINDVIDGISFTLLGAGSSTLTIAQNNSSQTQAVATAIQGMVNAYNAALDYIAQNGADRTLTDSSVGMIQTQLLNLFGSQLSNVGGLTSLLDLGISLAPATSGFTKAGNGYTSGNDLQIDMDQLNSLLSTNSAEVNAFFNTAVSGFSALVNTSITNITQAGGIIPTNTQWINENITKINRNIDKEEQRLEQIKDYLTRRYTQLNAILDKYDRLGSMLENSFSRMNPSGRK